MLKRYLALFVAAFGIAHFSFAQEEILPAEKLPHETGYFNTTELNFSFGIIKEYAGFPGGSSALYTGLQTINGYRFNQYLSVGLGIGVD